MFKSVTLRNFQSHINTVVPLSPGINLITGTSDHGKSAIARGIKWAVINRPYKDVGLRNDTVDENTEFSVSLELDNDVTVTRFKDSATNGYRLSTQKEPLKVIKTDVPQEVQEVLKMTDINIQEQHNPYFLLNDKGSAVAAAFNELVGLSVMDQCVEESKSEVNTAKAALKSIDIEVARINKEIKEVIDVTDIEALTSQAKILHSEYITIQNTLADFDNLINVYDTCVKHISTYTNLLDACSKKIAVIDKTAKRLELCENKLSDMSSAIDSYIKINKTIASIIQPEINIVYIENLIDQVSVVSEKCDNMDTLITKYSKLYSEVSDITIQMQTMQAELTCLMEQYTDCPLCGSILHN